MGARLEYDLVMMQGRGALWMVHLSANAVTASVVALKAAVFKPNIRLKKRSFMMTHYSYGIP